MHIKLMTMEGVGKLLEIFIIFHMNALLKKLNEECDHENPLQFDNECKGFYDNLNENEDSITKDNIEYLINSFEIEGISDILDKEYPISLPLYYFNEKINQMIIDFCHERKKYDYAIIKYIYLTDNQKLEILLKKSAVEIKELSGENLITICKQKEGVDLKRIGCLFDAEAKKKILDYCHTEKKYENNILSYCNLSDDEELEIYFGTQNIGDIIKNFENLQDNGIQYLQENYLLPLGPELTKKILSECFVENMFYCKILNYLDPHTDIILQLEILFKNKIYLDDRIMMDKAEGRCFYNLNKYLDKEIEKKLKENKKKRNILSYRLNTLIDNVRDHSVCSEENKKLIEEGYVDIKNFKMNSITDIPSNTCLCKTIALFFSISSSIALPLLFKYYTPGLNNKKNTIIFGMTSIIGAAGVLIPLAYHLRNKMIRQKEINNKLFKMWKYLQENLKDKQEKVLMEEM